MKNEMNCNLPWSESGKQLLLAINSYIQQHGGRKSLLLKIEQEERDIRKEQYVRSYAGNYSHIIRKDRKAVVMMRGEKGRIFKTTTDCSLYIGIKTSNIRAAIHKCTKCNGFRFMYI